MTNVRHEIQKLAAEFAENVVGKLRNVLNNEFLGGSAGGGSKPHVNGVASESPRAGRPRKSGRLHRTPEEIQALSGKIVELLKQNRDGMRAEAIREALGIERREWQKPLSIALESGAINKSGEKRATVYTATEASSTPSSKNGKTKKKAKAKAKKKTAKARGKFKGDGRSKKSVSSIRDSMPPSPLDEGEDETEESESDDKDAW
jgi:hypothetical protein